MEKISIIIITLNEEKYLPRLLESLRKQTNKNFEIILSDSNSKDKTIEIAKEYTTHFKEFRIKKLNATKGPAYGRNQGAKLAKYENLLFLDADTILPPDFIEKMLKIKNKKKIDCASFYYKDNNKRFIFNLIWAIANFFSWLIQLLGNPPGTGSFIYVKKEIHNKIGGFDEKVSYGEDTDYVRESKKYGKYRLMPIKLHFDSRRFEKEGIIKSFNKATSYNLIKFFKRIKYTPSNCNYKMGLEYNY